MSTQSFYVLTVSEFCQSAGISRSTWHKLKREGKAPAIVNVGGIQRIRREAIKAWLSENEECPSSYKMGHQSGLSIVEALVRLRD